jgi:hypothetical protein
VRFRYARCFAALSLYFLGLPPRWAVALRCASDAAPAAWRMFRMRFAYRTGSVRSSSYRKAAYASLLTFICSSIVSDSFFP